MGQAHTVMAVEQLALPDWFDLRSDRQMALWLSTIEEHDTILRRLTDTRSEEFSLLKQYRRTFQGRPEDSIREFVTFLAEYGQVLFRLRTQEQWTLPQFRLESVTPILERDACMRTVLRCRGFRAVSAAVRAATVGAQALRSQGRLDCRELRYGLLADLGRTGSTGREALLERISAFVEAYNAETARRLSSGIPALRVLDSEWTEFRRRLEALPRNIAPAGLLAGMATCIPGAGASRASEVEAEGILTA
jgi:hypothetical protein